MKVGIIGLGRIGLPLALALSANGVIVYGFDADDEWIKALKSGSVELREKMFTELISKVLNKKFYPLPYNKNDLNYLNNVGYVVITVGVQPKDETGKTDLAPLLEIIDDIHDYINGRTVIIRTTVPIGTTRKLKQYIEDNYSLKEGIDYFLAYVPERLVEGTAIEEEMYLPKIVGAFNDEGYKKAGKLFSVLPGPIYRASSPEVAEFVKLLDNAYRNLLLAFVNELALFAEKINIDFMEVLDLARKDYPRNIALTSPGPVSGYCLTKDPIIFSNIFRSVMGADSLTFLGRMINDRIVEWAINKVDCYSRVAVLGLSYKKDVDDYRMSHAIKLVEELLAKGITVYIHDPYLFKHRYTLLSKELKMDKVIILKDIKELQDVKPEAVVLATPHSEYMESRRLLDGEWLLLDLYNALYSFRNEFRKARYKGLGV